MGRFDREYRRSNRLPNFLRAVGILCLIIIFLPFRRMWFADYASFDLLDTYGRYGGAAIATVHAAIQARNDFPHFIWQTDSEMFNVPHAEQKDSWKRLNPEYQYGILIDEELDAWVDKHFAHSSSLVAFWHDLRVPEARHNLFRYLVMLSVGGIYSEVDTTCTKPIAEWLPTKYRHSRKVRAMVGLAYNQNVDPRFHRPNSFAQWTLAAEPGHPIFEVAITRVMSNLEFIARMQQTTLPLIELTDEEVLEATGSGVFTDAVIEVLRDQTGDPSLDIKRFDGMMLATIFGDVLIQPVNAFASEQKWLETNPEFGDVLATHEFKRTWEKGQNPADLVHDDMYTAEELP